MSDILKLIGKLKFIRDHECKTTAEVKAMNDAITELSKQPDQRWIPCTPDTMPEDGRYLCTYENEEGICVDFGSVIDGAWYIMPIAYLPSPEPYGGEQE